MILSDFVLLRRRNQVWSESGIDSRQHSPDKKYFDAYPYTVEYRYNSRGFRDAEWPISIDELKNSIWCFGDSFTAGIGSPIDHTWVSILQKQTGIRCINVSMDGASNEWIARKINRVLEEINPQWIVVQWSYLHRTESSHTELPEEDLRIFELPYISTDNQLNNFRNIRASISNTTTVIVESCIPKCVMIHYYPFEIKDKINQIKGSDWPDVINMSYDEVIAIDKTISDELKNFKIYKELVEYFKYKDLFLAVDLENLEVKQIDFARDQYHYDHLTAGRFVDSIIGRFTTSSS